MFTDGAECVRGHRYDTAARVVARQGWAVGTHDTQEAGGRHATLTAALPGRIRLRIPSWQPVINQPKGQGVHRRLSSGWGGVWFKFEGHATLGPRAYRRARSIPPRAGVAAQQARTTAGTHTRHTHHHRTHTATHTDWHTDTSRPALTTGYGGLRPATSRMTCIPDMRGI
jgi:hypothetical protein